MSIKNIIGLGLVGFVILAFSACGEKKANVAPSMNSTEKTKKPVEEIKEPVVKPSKNSQEAGISEELHSVTSIIDGKNVSLTSVHFAFDEYTLNADMQNINRKNAGIIDSVIKSHGTLKIKLEGNSDEWGTDEYNQALGLRRAKSAKDALISVGISKKMISTITLGESSPICEDRTVKCWKLNRRVDYKLLP
jgi:peptidoglycan-associated lipoprotein